MWLFMIHNYGTIYAQPYDIPHNDTHHINVIYTLAHFHNSNHSCECHYAECCYVIFLALCLYLLPAQIPILNRTVLVGRVNSP